MEMSHDVTNGEVDKFIACNSLRIIINSHNSRGIYLVWHVVLRRLWAIDFSQGLLTLMCSNSKLKADINFFFFFLLRRQRSKVYYNCMQNKYDSTPGGFVIAIGAKIPFFIILDSTPKLYYLFQFFFLIMIHTCLLPKTVSAFAK